MSKNQTNKKVRGIIGLIKICNSKLVKNRLLKDKKTIIH